MCLKIVINPVKINGNGILLLNLHRVRVTFIKSQLALYSAFITVSNEGRAHLEIWMMFP